MFPVPEELLREGFRQAVLQFLAIRIPTENPDEPIFLSLHLSEQLG